MGVAVRLNRACGHRVDDPSGMVAIVGVFSMMFADSWDRVCGVFSVALAVAGAAPVALAGISKQTAPVPGGFIQTRYTIWDYFSMRHPPIGDDLWNEYWRDFFGYSQSTFGAAETGSVSVDGFPSGVQVSMNAQANLGEVSIFSSQVHPNSGIGGVTTIDAGWQDRLTISHPDYVGQQGFIQVRLRVKGQLQTLGFSGHSRLSIQPFKDNAGIFLHPLFSRGDANALPTALSYQDAYWARAVRLQTRPKVVASTLVFVIPFRFGTPFTLGVWVRAESFRTGGSAPFTSTAITDFSDHGVVWDGILQVCRNTGTGYNYVQITGETISALSGTDWRQPRVVCDSLDFNGDGYVDSIDLDAYFSVLGEGACIGNTEGACGDLDFNNDSSVDPTDIDAYFRMLEDGPCF